MKKTLIYCMVWENENIEIYAGLAYRFLKSLREKGAVEGDVFLYTDSNRDWSLHSVYSQIKKIDTTSWNCHPMWGKVQLGATQDFSVYEKIVYLDVDLLLLAPLSPFLPISLLHEILFNLKRLDLHLNLVLISMIIMVGIFSKEILIKKNKRHLLIEKG